MVLCFLLVAFLHVWGNRIEIQETPYGNPRHSIIYNKWTGNHCLFSESKAVREKFESEDLRYKKHQLTVCAVDEHGKISLP